MRACACGCVLFSSFLLGLRVFRDTSGFSRAKQGNGFNVGGGLRGWVLQKECPNVNKQSSIIGISVLPLFEISSFRADSLLNIKVKIEWLRLSQMLGFRGQGTTSPAHVLTGPSTTSGGLWRKTGLSHLITLKSLET